MDPPAGIREVSASWRQAAARLSAALAHTDDRGIQLALLRRLSRQFHRIGYPGLLKLLLIVAESDDQAARGRLAELIGYSLARRDLPGGPLTAWGASHLWTTPADGGGIAASRLGVAPQRHFAPIEYLTVWYGQRTQRSYLDAGLYHDALTKLISLVALRAEASEAYCRQIEEDLAAGAEGAYTRLTRLRLSVLADAWRRGMAPARIADAVLAADANAPDRG